LPLSIIKGVLCGEEGVLMGNGQRTLAGRKEPEQEQVMGKLAAMPRPGAALASRAHLWLGSPENPLGGKEVRRRGSEGG
jgi:hypothetical protein